ncbi:MAG: hypothetical protein Q8P20_07040 [bacterium]|nr:hypothetical protein [bacterium]
MIPKWAQELTLKACIWWEKQGHATEIPDIMWKHSKYSKQSSGKCYSDSISITSGTDRKDAKLVVLHELAHWFNPAEHHGLAFWQTAWELYKWAGLPINYCKRREYPYKKTAKLAYQKLKKVK